REPQQLHARPVPGAGCRRDGEARSHRHRLLQHRPRQPQSHRAQDPEGGLDAAAQPRQDGQGSVSGVDMAAVGNPAMARFSNEIAALGMKPLWERVPRLEPGTAAQAAIWRWSDTRPLLMRACELITAKQAERRVLMLENPALAGTTFITPALFTGL